jgi:hypothetical protein
MGLDCVKTQKFEGRRESFFSDQAKANSLTNSRGYNCDSEKRSFYRRGAPLRFCTARSKADIATDQLNVALPPKQTLALSREIRSKERPIDHL